MIMVTFFCRIHCRTGQSLSAWTGEMIIAVRNVGSGNMSNIVVQGHNPNVIYSYLVCITYHMGPASSKDFANKICGKG